MFKQLFSVSFIFATLFASAQQDDITVLQYNLLNYGNYSSYCNTTNNHVDDKDEYLKTILGHVQPDIFSVNELGVSIFGLENIYAKRILDSTLNINGVTKYDKAVHTGTSNLVNMLYFNMDKLGLASQEIIVTDASGSNIIREIDIYNLYYNDFNTLQTQDTVFLSCIVAHLKAGSNVSDANEREDAAKALMTYLDNNDVHENRLFMGDFNVYEATEAAYVEVTNPSTTANKFNDPINQEGEWNSNSIYKDIHSQSTWSNTTNNDCPASGGMDDRFDFILASNAVIDNSRNVQYIQGSYKALGQDGSYYNTDMNTTTNGVVPSSVASALKSMSDHLPIVADFRITSPSVGIEENTKNHNVSVTNPIENKVTVRFLSHLPKNVMVKLYTSTGQLLYSNNSPTSVIQIEASDFAKGVYILNVESTDGNTTKKLVKL